MEDIISALLDVVRAQHSATEGTDEAPFNMDDIVDMAMNLLGRPDEAAEEKSMVDNIENMVTSMAPDIFPPKTFEQMDNSEKALSAASMIENRFMRNTGSASSAVNNTQPVRPEPVQTSYSSYEEEEEEEDQDVGNLNDLIYKNFMSMMGLSTPQVEFPFDRSQIVYGKEKSITEQLAEEEEEKKQGRREEAERQRKLSAWELAQNAIDSDEAAHAKEPYVPQPVEQPKAKSASQMAAEAIRRSEEQDRMQLEIERQAEVLMAEARKRGQDPMKFMLHQQEILQYMEKNTDELVSFEDYEDLSPEEKMEIERQIYVEKQIADGVNPDEVDTEVPEEYVPEEIKARRAAANPASAGAASVEENPSGEPSGGMSTFDEDTLRALSQQVVSENSSMILGENSEEDIEAVQEQIFQNLRRMMAGSGTSVAPEDIGMLLAQAAANASDSSNGGDRENSGSEEETTPAPAPVAVEAPTPARPMSAVELAMAAQKSAKPEPQEERQTVSAADLAKAAQETARRNPVPQAMEEEAADDVLDMNFDELDDLFAEDRGEDDLVAATPADAINVSSSMGMGGGESVSEESTREEAPSVVEKESQAEVIAEEEDDDEYEYVDPDELVLGDHTQAEIDEAMENLNSLGLEGEVFERAKRMLLLELAGSEAALEAWLYEQENSKKKKKANVSALDEDNLDDLSDFDEDLFEKELEMAIDEDFEEELSDDLDIEADELNETEEESQDSEESDHSEHEASELDDEEFSGEWGESEQTEDSAVEETMEDLVEEVREVSEETEQVVAEAEQAEAETKEAEVSSIEEAIETTAKEDVETDVIKEAAKEKKSSKNHRSAKTRKGIVHKKEKSAEKMSDKKEKPADKNEKAKKAEDTKASQTSKEAAGESTAEERGYQVSVRKPFVLKNSLSYMDKLEDFITENQENRKLSTGFKKLDGLLRFGLHKGSYFIDAQPQYLKNSFMQQMADRAAESGVDVLYISTELSRYDLMVDTISRLSYEMNGQDSEKAHSVMSIMTGEDGATLESLHDELNWYRGRISEHLFILDQEAVDEYIDSMEEEAAGSILEELIRSIVREGAHKPVVFIDNIENILSVEDSEDMKPLMDGIRKLAKELSIPILMSYGYAQAESEEELSAEELRFHESLGNMCDVYLELQYANMITEDYVEITEEDIRDMIEDGDSILIDILIHRNRRPMRASCQIEGTPKFNFFEE